MVGRSLRPIVRARGVQGSSPESNHETLGSRIIISPNSTRHCPRIRLYFTSFVSTVPYILPNWVSAVKPFNVNRGFALVLALACAFVVRAQSGASVQAWRYDPRTHSVEIRINNVSQRGITAFNMTVAMKHEDGTQAVGEAGADFSTGIGSLAAETNYDTRLYSAKAVTNVEAVIDVILYADGTSEVQNKRAYDRIVTQRKKLAERSSKKRI
jgi:hypothetical protein